jgi:hypothetical protein
MQTTHSGSGRFVTRAGRLAVAALAAVAMLAFAGSAAAKKSDGVGLGDRAEIHDLISEYSMTWDGKDAQGYVNLFTDDALLEFRFAPDGQVVQTTLRSNAERLAFAENSFRTFVTNGVQTRHYQTNTLLRRADRGRVTGTTMVLIAQQFQGERTPRIVHSGIYTDRYVKVRGEWRFESRVLRIDHEM